MMKQRSNLASIEKAAIDTLDIKWITKEKQKARSIDELHRHNFEAIAHSKQF